MQPVRQIREMIALAMLAVSTYTDIRQRSIYIVPLIVSAAGSVAITAVCIAAQDPTMYGNAMLPELVSSALFGLLFMIAARCFKSHIGAGDGYLMAALGIVAGTDRNLVTVMCATFLSAAYALVSLLYKKRSKRKIPFAPFMMAGYFLVLIRYA